MKCPVDSAELRMVERQGVEVDYCPQCRGVWLDRGELDKIIERSAGSPEYERERAPDRGEYREPYKHRKRESFLERLFDF